ncbi:MAG: caspase family protein, partial [Duncaniella sp.]|nr:caspase family protein [Duncaniella sp.]
LSFGKMRKAFSDILDLAGILNGEANLIIYYAGHGIPDNKTKDAFLMPTDADGTDTGICISLGDLYNKIEQSNLNRCVVFLDACFSGAQRGGEMIVAARGVKLKPKEVTPAGKTIVFSATSDDEAAYSHKSEQHGLFTYFLLSKLQESKGKVSLGDLAGYIQEKVALESRRINNIAQTPKVSVAAGLADSWKSIKLIK